MKNLTIYLYFSILYVSNALKTRQDPDEFVNTLTLIRSKGYPAEEHEVITLDGYKLKLHRIPQGRVRSSINHGTSKRPVALLQHGLLDASSTWVVNFPEQSLGFILADAGYDVWLGNVRGNKYSLDHVKYNSSEDDAFWGFSWSDMAEYDLPSMINYALNYTGEPDLFYIGHSQGTLIGFTQFQKVEFQNKIKLFLALGPVATVGHATSPVRYLADLGVKNTQQIWFYLFGKKDFMPSDSIIQWFADKACNIVVADKLICENILFVITGPSKHMNVSRIPVYTTHAPAGTSVKNLAHFAQMVISKKYEMYDFGSSKENNKHYNQTTPPLYDARDVDVPVALYWAENDWLADPTDVNYLRQNLKNLVDDYCVLDWNHLDFIWAINGRQSIYDRMVKLMNSYI